MGGGFILSGGITPPSTPPTSPRVNLETPRMRRSVSCPELTRSVSCPELTLPVNDGRLAELDGSIPAIQSEPQVPPTPKPKPATGDTIENKRCCGDFRICSTM